MSVCRSHRAALTRLLISISPGARIDTGINASKERSGNSPLRSRWRRNAPAATAMTTSFKVHPRALVIRFMSAIGMLHAANSRWFVTVVLKPTRGGPKENQRCFGAALRSPVAARMP
jgi:hypothetical protein